MNVEYRMIEIVVGKLEIASKGWEKYFEIRERIKITHSKELLKSARTPRKALNTHTHTHTHAHTHTHIQTHTHIYIYIYIYEVYLIFFDYAITTNFMYFRFILFRD